MERLYEIMNTKIVTRICLRIIFELSQKHMFVIFNTNTLISERCARLRFEVHKCTKAISLYLILGSRGYCCGEKVLGSRGKGRVAPTSPHLPCPDATRSIMPLTIAACSGSRSWRAAELSSAAWFSSTWARNEESGRNRRMK